jgi:OOP family OmpA-OmpF porin
MFTQNIYKLWRVLLVGMFSVISIAISSIAQAEGWYGGVGFGNSKIKDDTFCSDASSLFDPGSSCSSDDTDTGWKVFIGNQFNKNAAIEFGYIDLGKTTGNASGTVYPNDRKWGREATGFNLANRKSARQHEFSVLQNRLFH